MSSEKGIDDQLTTKNQRSEKGAHPRVDRLRIDAATYGSTIVLIVGIIITAIFQPVFLSISNIANVLSQIAVLGILTMAQTIVLISGGIDLSVETAARSAMERVAQDAGRLDGLINVAGGFRWEKISEGTIDGWDAMYKLNLRTAVLSCQAALPYMLRSPSGRIVNVGAMGAQKAAAGMGPYAASKAGVAQLTASLADELKDRGITVNAILPSTLDTPKNRADIDDASTRRLEQVRQRRLA